MIYKTIGAIENALERKFTQYQKKERIVKELRLICEFYPTEKNNILLESAKREANLAFEVCLELQILHKDLIKKQ